MSQADTTPGFLSKMVKFVRNPVTNWSELDAAQIDREDALSKQLLKEMIERKRRNDFVRKREFDMLRKLRKREALAGVGQDPAAGRASFFQSSLPATSDDRAQTIKKIDEIEAQMSMQWWKTKSARSEQPVWPDRGADTPALSPNEWVSAKAHIPTTSAALAGAPALTSAASHAAAPSKISSRFAGQSLEPTGNEQPTTQPDFSPTSILPSKVAAIGVEKTFLHDAELEEVAIRFANGDDEGAELGLLEVLGSGGGRSTHVETWLALFDLYRANGWRDKFESAALDFVGCFNRSAPQWFSMPDMVTLLRQPVAPGVAAHWICPSVMGVQTVAALKAALTRAPMPWRLDWRNLKKIDSTAVNALHQLFSSWSEQNIELRFIGDEQLQMALRNGTVSGDATVPPQWWLLRLMVLRVTHQPDDFEITALDFCVTYEVSPPAWMSARCQYKAINSQGEAEVSSTVISEILKESNAMMNGDDTLLDSAQSISSTSASVELSGQVQGDVQAVLESLNGKFSDTECMVISCAKLIRVDFSAAGALLNWVSEREAEGRTVHFAEVNRLVAAFFSVIGITEHATITVRVD